MFCLVDPNPISVTEVHFVNTIIGSSGYTLLIGLSKHIISGLLFCVVLIGLIELAEENLGYFHGSDI